MNLINAIAKPRALNASLQEFNIFVNNNSLMLAEDQSSSLFDCIGDAITNVPPLDADNSYAHSTVMAIDGVVPEYCLEQLDDFVPFPDLLDDLLDCTSVPIFDSSSEYSSDHRELQNFSSDPILNSSTSSTLSSPSCYSDQYDFPSNFFTGPILNLSPISSDHTEAPNFCIDHLTTPTLTQDQYYCSTPQPTPFEQPPPLDDTEFDSLLLLDNGDCYLQDVINSAVLPLCAVSAADASGGFGSGESNSVESRAAVGRTSSKSSDISLEEIRLHFCMPITRAAKELNVGLTVLKKRCRELGIPRWPHRKMKSLRTLINNVRELGKDEQTLSKELENLEEYQRVMQENPEIQFTERTKKLRQACFKANYKKRRAMQDPYYCHHADFKRVAYDQLQLVTYDHHAIF